MDSNKKIDFNDENNSNPKAGVIFTGYLLVSVVSVYVKFICFQYDLMG